MILTSNKSNPVRPVGSSVTVSCTVELSSGSESDVPLTVSFRLSKTDPAGSPLTLTTPSVSGSTYTTVAMIDYFAKDQSGVYTCTAVINSTSLFLTKREVSNAIRITTGECMLSCLLYISIPLFRCLPLHKRCDNSK